MEGKKQRLFYIDNIRLLVIALVVVMHLSVTYSGMGGWYYTEGGKLGMASAGFFLFLQGFLQAFFMGLLFLIAGYFTPGAYDKKGFGKFIGDRAIRLGIPTALYMFIIHPAVAYMVGRQAPGQGFFSYYWQSILNGDFISGTGPLWFALALLVFTLIYAFVRLAAGKSPASPSRINVGWKSLAALVAVIAALAFLIRTVLPIGTSVYNMMLCYFAQYIVLFTVGIKAYRNDWFSKLSYKTGVRLLCWAPLWGFCGWGLLMLGYGALSGGDISVMNGGLTWQSAAYALWESFTAVAMDVGLLVLFREKFNGQGRLVKALSGSAFAVYVFHTPIIVAITLLFRPVAWLPGFKFITMIAVCLPVCFGVGWLLKKVPLIKKIL